MDIEYKRIVKPVYLKGKWGHIQLLYAFICVFMCFYPQMQTSSVFGKYPGIILPFLRISCLFPVFHRFPCIFAHRCGWCCSLAVAFTKCMCCRVPFLQVIQRPSASRYILHLRVWYFINHHAKVMGILRTRK